MLQSLLNVPTTEEDWLRWGFSHSEHHQRIRQAIQVQGNINLNDYQIYPINFDFSEAFLERNQQLHNDMNTSIGTQGSDLKEVDLGDKGQLESWISSHYQEHFNVAQRLGI